MPTRDRFSQQQHVLDAAEALFLEHGYVATTMSEVADAIGMSRPALYLVYPCRDAIFAAVAAPGTTSVVGQDEGLSEWLARVLDLWLGRAGTAPRDGGRDRQSPTVTLKQQALLCSVLKDGLAHRIGAEVSEDFQNAIVQLIALCVRGLQDAHIGAGEGKALLNIQVSALASMANTPGRRAMAWNEEARKFGRRAG